MAAPGTLPSGTVTFLFSDVEGSTRLWEQRPDAMPAALQAHDTLLRTAIEARGGHVFKTVGDAFCAAFARADDALLAALAIQQGLLTLLPETLPLRVRLVLHTGIAEERDGDYFGPALNRTARLLALAHGGQTLLSQTTHSLLAAGALPPDVSFGELGRHALKDLTQPELVFQLWHPSLPSSFPPLRSPIAPPHNLPQQLSSFVGREREMAQITALLPKSRLLTLTGPGGTGKTRLSLQAAAALLENEPEQMEDGAWLIELATLSDPALVAQEIAATLGARSEASKTAQQTLVDFLRPRRLLLLLDNCEHLLDACARLADALLRVCPGLHILASSREPFGISGETVYAVPALSVPNPLHLPSLESLGECESVRLFVERARGQKAEFALSAGNAQSVAQVCARLDGIPLAIELASARIKALPVEQIALRLNDRFRLLTGGSRAALPRQQTLRAAIDWSYDLLTEPERALLRRLSVFAGGWTLDAAEAVCAGGGMGGNEGIDEWDVLDLLSHLIDKSLVQQQDARYRLLETLRQYGQERLNESAEGDALRARHQQWFLRLAEDAEPQLGGMEQTVWLERLESEHDNLRAALAWSLSVPGEAGASLRLVGLLWPFWYTRGYLSEGQGLLQAALMLAGEEADPAARIRALTGAGVMSVGQGQYDTARAFYEQALALSREREDTHSIAGLLNHLGNVFHYQADYHSASALYTESVSLHRQRGDTRRVAQGLGNLGFAAAAIGDYEQAWQNQSESVRLLREMGDQQSLANGLNNLAEVPIARGDNETAQTLSEESLTLFRALGNKRGTASSLCNLAVLAARRGDMTMAQALAGEAFALQQEIGNRRGVAGALHIQGVIFLACGAMASAERLLREALALRRSLGNNAMMAETLECIGSLRHEQAQDEQAVRLWGAAAALREAVGFPRVPSDEANYQERVLSAQAALGAEAFAQAWAQGAAMTGETAVRDALNEAQA